MYCYKPAGARIRAYVLQHSGLPAISVNHGLKMAHGKYITWLCDDDEWKPEMLSAQVGHLEDHPDEGAVYTFAEGVHFCLPRVGWIYQELLRENFIPGTMMWRREYSPQFNDRSEFRGYEDWLAWLDISKQCKVGCVPSALRIQHHTDGSISSENSDLHHLQTIAKMYDHYHELKLARIARIDAFWYRWLPALVRDPIVHWSRRLCGLEPRRFDNSL